MRFQKSSVLCNLFNIFKSLRSCKLYHLTKRFSLRFWNYNTPINHKIIYDFRPCLVKKIEEEIDFINI